MGGEPPRETSYAPCSRSVACQLNGDVRIEDHHPNAALTETRIRWRTEGSEWEERERERKKERKKERKRKKEGRDGVGGVRQRPLSAPAALLLAEASLRWQQHPTPTFDNSEACFSGPTHLATLALYSYSVLLRQFSVHDPAGSPHHFPLAGHTLRASPPAIENPIAAATAAEAQPRLPGYKHGAVW